MRFTKSLSLAAVSVFAVCAVSVLPALLPQSIRATVARSVSNSTPCQFPSTLANGKRAPSPRPTVKRLAALVYDRLLTLDDYGRFQPALATEWSHDPASKNWQFKLRAGVKFSDGSALTPKEIAAALHPLLPSGFQIIPRKWLSDPHCASRDPDLLEQLASGPYFIFRAQPDGALIGHRPFSSWLAARRPSFRRESLRAKARALAIPCQ